jgi:hypothetical protein
MTHCQQRPQILRTILQKIQLPGRDELFQRTFNKTLIDFVRDLIKPSTGIGISQSLFILGSTVRIQYLGAWECHDLIRYRRYDRTRYHPP